MKVAGSIGISTRASMLALAVLVALCAAGLAGPAMGMADGQDCAGPFCEIQIGCGQPIPPQNTLPSAMHLPAAPMARACLPPPAGADIALVDLSPPRLLSSTLRPPASRAPPVV